MTQKWGFKLILWIAIALLLLVAFLPGCTTLKKQEFLTPQLQEKINSKLTLTQVKNNPGSYRGKMVLWGGEIIKTVPKEKETTIEVLNLPLDKKQRPQDTDNSQGRFLVSHSGFLDPYIYRQGRDITVIGKIIELQKNNRRKTILISCNKGYQDTSLERRKTRSRDLS